MGLFKRKPVPVQIIFDDVRFQALSDNISELQTRLAEATDKLERTGNEVVKQVNEAVKTANRSASRLETAQRRAK